MTPPPVRKDFLTRRRLLKGTAWFALGESLLNLAPAHADRSASDRADQAMTAHAEQPPSPRKTLYLIATAHNDTQWNWTVQDTIRHFVPNTMRPNWDLFRKYPDYVFNYEGVIHYMFFKEYHPGDWAELQDWVRKGRWRLSGSWINAVDVCNPSAESLFRQALYGQQFFRREFGQVSRDIFLPDCFGFPFSLPTIGRHSGLTAFSTQKFDSWGGFRPAPFTVGRWKGVDGSELVSALKPGPYGQRLRSDIAADPDWDHNRTPASGKPIDFRYFGTGDVGGTPDEESIVWMEKAVHNTAGHSIVRNTGADQMAKDLTATEIAALPVYSGELLMTTHGVGSYTSQAAHKKWNRMNEQFADAAERVSLAAALLGGPAYPQATLTSAWLRTLWHQFHDDLPGTCIPQAYTFSWNDDLLNLNQFAQIITTGVGTIAQHLDTRVEGVPLVLYNPLDQFRTEAVEATLTFPAPVTAVRVFDPTTGVEYPCQVSGIDGNTVRLIVLATVPPVGCVVYDVRPSPTPGASTTGLTVSPTGLESKRYRVRVNETGDIASVFDKRLNRELLSAPASVQEFANPSPAWPAWEILWKTVQAPPRGIVHENVRVEIVEKGPARVALAVTRTLGDSKFVQTIRLTPDGDYVAIHNDVDWRTPATLVKAAFPLTATNPMATFDIGLGTVERPNHQRNLYEVNGQQWADITDASGSHGTAILTNYKYGWDKPDDNTLRLTLMHTPQSDNYPHQETNDIGRHQFDFGIAGHVADWRAGQIPQCAARFNQPLLAFQTTPHPGTGGNAFSLVQISTPQVAIRALKKAEDSDEWVVRVQELHGQPVSDVAVTFTTAATHLREINAAEESVDGTNGASLQAGKLVFNLTAYQPRTFAVRLAPMRQKVAPIQARTVDLPFNRNGVTRHGALTAGSVDARGDSYAAELWPKELTRDGIPFRLGATDKPNLVSCTGQTIPLPKGSFNRLYLLASSADGDRMATFTVQSATGPATAHPIPVQDWAEHVGQWDSRLVHPSRGDGGPQIVRAIRDGKVVGVDRLRRGYVKRAAVAWVGSHRHGVDGDQAYLYSYLFQYRIDLPAGATAITLPNNPKINVMAMTVAQNRIDDTAPAGVLFEPTLPDTPPTVAAPIRPTGPPAIVYESAPIASFTGTGDGTATDVDTLPTDPTAPWTINLFLYTDRIPEPLTIFGGFGDGSDTSGAQRYLIYFQGGIEFWGSNVDIASRVPIETGKWQMLTATFDGRTVRLYRNTKPIKAEAAELTEAAPVVRIAPPPPWRNGHRFAGQIQKFTIWNGALTPLAIAELWEGAGFWG